MITANRYESFAARLTRLRQARRLSVAELALGTQVNRDAVHKWEAGKRRPTVATLRRLAVALGVELTELLTEDL